MSLDSQNSSDSESILVFKFWRKIQKLTFLFPFFFCIPKNGYIWKMRVFPFSRLCSYYPYATVFYSRTHPISHIYPFLGIHKTKGNKKANFWSLRQNLEISIDSESAEFCESNGIKFNHLLLKTVNFKILLLCQLNFWNCQFQIKI